MKTATTTVFALTALLALSGALADGGKTYTSGGNTFTSGGTCVAHADAGVWKEATSAAAVAVANAIASGCSATSVDVLVKNIEVHLKVFADAIVKVHASAAARCSTYGRSFGCAAAIGHADGEIKAVIALLSKAYAKAVNNCYKCDPVFAKAKTFNIAALVVKLTAQAAATAKAKVCVGPNQTASAFAYKRCTAAIWAHGCAYALAEAMIYGGCTNLQATAVTTVRNMVHVDPYCACNGSKYTSTSDHGLGWYKHYTPVTYAAYKKECEVSATQLV